MFCHSSSLKVSSLIQGEINCELFDAKHESHLLHHDGQLSYDPKPYGVDHACRFHIKTMQVSFATLFLKYCVGLLFLPTGLQQVPQIFNKILLMSRLAHCTHCPAHLDGHLQQPSMRARTDFDATYQQHTLLLNCPYCGTCTVVESCLAICTGSSSAVDAAQQLQTCSLMSLKPKQQFVWHGRCTGITVSVRCLLSIRGGATAPFTLSSTSML